ncbi:MAG TPA: thiolase family protein [Candidatus Thermoplasmatota archaeon]|nr:thiolase family protein [Candidatus Thermoplasmatota archaeon]
MGEAFLLGYARTPFGKRRGGLQAWRPEELAAFTLDALLDRAGLAGAAVEDVLLGCVTQTGEQGGNVARLAVLLSERLPVETPASTINRVCGSSQQAVNTAAALVASGQAGLVVAGGVESMTRVPMGCDVGEPHPRLVAERLLVHQSVGAERMAEKWSITRAEMDAFSLESHRRAVAAQDRGFFSREIVPVPAAPRTVRGGVPSGSLLVADEHPRRGTSREALAALRPAFRADGKITAGNSSGINDGATALLVGSKEKARELGLTPLARIVATDAVGSDPELVLSGPIPATRRVLQKAGLTVRDVDVFEINEAFASVVLAWQREIGAPLDRVNPNGGAIALGHPLGASGGRLMMTAVNALHSSGKDRALVSMCIANGQAIATLLERV